MVRESLVRLSLLPAANPIRHLAGQCRPQLQVHTKQPIPTHLRKPSMLPSAASLFPTHLRKHVIDFGYFQIPISSLYSII
ncbi:unnamed protein product [Cuscuta campestris]|uniref:Uncharacterized protein n=1 Tax=Cuscuta campestris TaxID=132261 RepID=A0A484KEW3_9ASTE|nr:unnamed protein product [Cuscuta campestris]